MTDWQSSPIIILGMHRSGTSLLTRKLEQLGLFVGSQKESNHEALFFLKLHEWLLKSTSATWDAPGPVEYLLQNKEVLEVEKDYLMHRLSSLESWTFLGIKALFSGSHLLNMNFPWGWKDPRTILFLPIWLEIFPNAKLIYVDRNSMDVANSLRTRASNQFSINREKHFKRKKLGSLYKKEGVFCSSVRSLDIVEALRIATTYKQTAEQYMSSAHNPQFTFQYEEFLDRPRDILLRLNKFCNLDASEQQIQLACSGVNKSRANAYLHDEALSKVAMEHPELMDRTWPGPHLS